MALGAEDLRSGIMVVLRLGWCDDGVLWRRRGTYETREEEGKTKKDKGVLMALVKGWLGSGRDREKKGVERMMVQSLKDGRRGRFI